MKPFIYHIIVRDKENKAKVCDFHGEAFTHSVPCEIALDLAKNEGLKEPYIDMLAVLGTKDF